jgi:hypothetical protein
MICLTSLILGTASSCSPKASSNINAADNMAANGLAMFNLLLVGKNRELVRAKYVLRC